MDKTTLLFALLTLVAFVVIAISFAVFILRRIGGKEDAVVFKIKVNRNDELKAAPFLKSANFPVAFDIVIQHLGSEREDYIVVEHRYADRAEKAIRSTWPNSAVSRSDDYLVFHHGGFYDVLRVLVPEDDFSEKDISLIDLSRVNDIGEGVVVRFFRDPRSKEKQISVLSLFSAPSQYQLREIEDVVSASFKGRKIYSPKNKEEIFRAFGSAEEVAR